MYIKTRPLLRALQDATSFAALETYSLCTTWQGTRQYANDGLLIIIGSNEAFNARLTHKKSSPLMKQEIEILWKLDEDVTSALAKLDPSKFVHTKKTIDTYFFDPVRPALQPSSEGRLTSCLRVRETDKGNSITHKVDHFDGASWLYSDEIETAVHDAGEMKRLLVALGLQPLVTVAVEKHSFNYAPYEIVVEAVDGLGGYVEIEYSADHGERAPLDVKRDIFEFAQGLGLHLGQEENAGKPELLLKQQMARSAS